MAAAQRAANRGVLIYAYDQAAWHGTDDLVAKLPDAANIVGGWVVDGPADAPEIVFFDRNESDPKAIYVARFRGNKLVSGRVLGEGEDRTLSPERRAMVAARNAAASALVAGKVRRCVDKPFNTVVLPPSGPGGAIPVYFLTPQMETDTIPLGGHYLVEVTDGKAGAIRPFTNSCLPMKPDPEQGKPVALMISHLLDPVPTEIHVFSSLAAQKPVYVMTSSNDATWAVEGNQIRQVGTGKK